jgi:hypothetical protein
LAGSCSRTLRHGNCADDSALVDKLVARAFRELAPPLKVLAITRGTGI